MAPAWSTRLIGLLWDFNFMMKMIALCMNTSCSWLWIKGLHESTLPADNQHELALMYHTVPAYNIILCCLILQYVVGEVPQTQTQRVYLTTGFTLYLVVGTVGIQNTCDNDFPPDMFVMSLMCVVIAIVFVVDFLKLENFFKDSAPEPRDARPGTSDDTQRSHPGTSDDTQRSRPGTSDDTKRSHPGTSDDTKRSRPGTSDDTQRSRPGTSDDTKRSRPGTPNDTQRSRPGTSDNTKPSRPGT